MTDDSGTVPKPGSDDRASQLDQLFLSTRQLLGSLGDTADEESFLAEALDSICRLVGVRFGALARIGNHGRLRLFLPWGFSVEEIRRVGRPPRGTGLLGNIEQLAAGEGNGMVLVDDLASHPEHSPFPDHHPEMKTRLAVPISTEKATYGWFHLCDRRDGQPFSREDGFVGRAFAQTMALILESSRLERRTRVAGQLADSVVHDVNNLLMVISGNVEVAQRRLRQGKPVVAELGMIQEAVDAGDALLRPLLALRREPLNDDEWVADHDAAGIPGEAGISGVSESPDTDPIIDKVPEAAVNRSGATVLVAEDSPQLRGLARAFLRAQGFEVLVAEDGVEALEVFGAHRDSIECVVLDLIMPRMSGVALYEQMSRIRPGLPCIFLTGDSEEAHCNGAIPEIAFLRKPLSFQMLQQRVDEVLGGVR